MTSAQLANHINNNIKNKKIRTMAVLVGSASPSSKALGKRPVTPYPDEVDIPPDTPFEPQDSIQISDVQATRLVTPTRQKRVLPSRSTRGGPGVGTCEIDLSILDALKRRGENDPLIPSTSKFVLTTNVSLLPSSSSTPSALAQNPYATERYFDRPEVIQAYKSQQEIQTPEFCLLSDVASVGGRLRARGEEESADTSDAAYEKRHRKYETFEKRQRLREKEKLQHEHYKLKERIDQLRATDSTSFLTLPNSTFPPVPEVDGTELTDGPATFSEGEWRKQMMIDVSFNLEERYRTLLARRETERQRGGPGPSIELDEQVGAEEVQEEEAEADESEVDKAEEDITSSRGRKLKLKIKITRHSATAKTQAITTKNGRVRYRSSLPPPLTGTPKSRSRRDGLELNTPQSTPGPSLQLRPVFMPPSDTAIASLHPTPRHSRSPSIADTKDASIIDRYNSYEVVMDTTMEDPSKAVEFDNSALVERPKKKFRLIKLRHSLPSTASESILSHTKALSEAADTTLDSAFSPNEGGENMIARKKQQPVILIAASRNADTPDARKTSRHVLAFGVRVPREIETLKDFELPSWLDDDDDDDDYYESGSEAQSPVRLPSPEV